MIKESHLSIENKIKEVQEYLENNALGYALKGILDNHMDGDVFLIPYFEGFHVDDSMCYSEKPKNEAPLLCGFNQSNL